MKRSSCESGKGCVPADVIGFCVAITMNGFGSSCAIPSIVTFPSSIDSSKADCVFADVRLISSPKSIFVKTAPGLNSNSPVDLLYIVNPVISEGIVSGVNCILL